MKCSMEVNAKNSDASLCLVYGATWFSERKLCIHPKCLITENGILNNISSILILIGNCYEYNVCLDKPYLCVFQSSIL